MESLSLTFYLAFKDFEHELRSEFALKKIPVKGQWGPFFLVEVEEEGEFQPMLWARWHGIKGKKLSIESVTKASRVLKEYPSTQWVHWGLDGLGLYRRGELILQKLPRPREEPLSFPFLPRGSAIGLLTLLSQNELLFFPKCGEGVSGLVPYGNFLFHEKKIGPPSRAYLKLWEFFTRTSTLPQPHEICLDLGASPGGWSWVLLQLKTRLISVDKAPLELPANDSLTFIQENAFTLDPKTIPHLDWFFCDVICYPEKLIDLIKKWRAIHPRCKFVCTMKFQKETDYESMEELVKTEGGSFIHLFNNKHEATWWR